VPLKIQAPEERNIIGPGRITFRSYGAFNLYTRPGAMNIALVTELRNALRRRGALPFVRVRLSFPVFKVLVLSGKRLAFCRLCLIGSRGRPINLLVQRRWNLGELGHWTINLVNAILENIANQKVDDAH